MAIPPHSASKAPHLHDLYSFLQIMKDGPCFASIEKIDNTNMSSALFCPEQDVFVLPDDL